MKITFIDQIGLERELDMGNMGSLYLKFLNPLLLKNIASTSMLYLASSSNFCCRQASAGIGGTLRCFRGPKIFLKCCEGIKDIREGRQNWSIQFGTNQ